MPHASKALAQLAPGGGNALRLARKMVNPFDGAPIRLSTLGDSAATTAVDLESNFPVNNAVWSGNWTSFSPGTSYVFSFRDPLRSIVYLATNQAAYQYNAQFFDGVSSGVNSTMSVPAFVNTQYDVVPLSYAWVTGSQPHGSNLYTGNNDGKYGFVWAQPGVTFQFTQSIGPVGSDFDQILIVCYNGGDETQIDNVGFAAATVNWLVPNSVVGGVDMTRGGYVRFIYNTQANPAVGQTLSVHMLNTQRSDVMCHRSVNGVEKHLSCLGTARINCGAVCLSNTAADLYNDGVMQAVALEASVDWHSLLGQASFWQWGTAVNVYEGPLKLGSYAFHKVGDLADLSFMSYSSGSYTTGTLGVPSEVSFPLSRSRYLAFVANANAVNSTLGDPQYPGLDFIIKMSYGIEFATTDPWFPAIVSSSTIADTNSALDIVRTVGQLYENPSHLRMLAQRLGAGFNFIKAHRGKIAKAISVLFPAFGPVANAIAGLG